jgi:hypothetical protein
MKIIVQETIQYLVEAESVQAAIQKIINDPHRDKLCFQVTDRKGWPEEHPEQEEEDPS